MSGVLAAVVGRRSKFFSFSPPHSDCSVLLFQFRFLDLIGGHE